MEYERICIIMNKSQMERDTINDQAISVMRYLSVVFIPEILLRSVQHNDNAKKLFVACVTNWKSLWKAGSW